MSYDSVERSVLDLLDNLQLAAEGVVEQHWKRVREEERKRTGWEHKSQLVIRCNRKGNSIKLEWYKIRWIGSKGKRTALREYIKKPAKFGYNVETLSKYARDWEKDLVAETEGQLATIRKESYFLNMVLRYLRMARAEHEHKDA